MELYCNGSDFSLIHEGNTILEYQKEKTFIYVGKGKESVKMYHGNFAIEDYLTERIPAVISELEKKAMVCIWFSAIC